MRRQAARVLLLDGEGRTLLFRGSDPARPEDGQWWFTPGGGLEPGESIEQAARRELREETGVRVSDLGPPIHQDHVEFPFDGRMLHQHQTYYRVRVDDPTVDVSGWTELERRALSEYRWWRIEDLRTTEETVYPRNLVTLLG